MRDVAGTLWSVQKIFDDGRKHFLAGGRKKGCFHALGDLSSMAYVCEGYATAASIHEATGKPVVVCFDAGNLSPVIEELAKFYPVKHWIIAADDDAHGETNIGRMKAEEAAARHSCSVMPASVLRQRLASLAAGMGSELPSPDYFRIITPDMQETGVPDLTTDEGKQAIEEHLDGVRLLILDNLSSLLRRGKENEAESWMLVQSWLLELRKRGISVLLVHHANKSGGQRGTSKKEDVLDTVIMLKRPEEYDPGEGATFSVHYEKARGFHGEDAQPFEARLVEEDKALRWKVEALKETLLEQAKALQAEGKSQRDIAQLLGISPSSVNRLLRRGG